MSGARLLPIRRPPRSVRITGWGSYVPERVLSNADLERIVDTSDEWIRTRTGIRERRVAAPHETTATLGAIAATRAIAVAGLSPDDIDVIVVATLTPDYPMPATAVLVKEAIGNTDRRCLRPRSGLLGVPVRLCHGRRLRPQRAGAPRARRRRRAAHALRRLLRSRYLHPLRRRSRGRRRLRLGGGGWRPRRPRDDDGPRRRLHRSGCPRAAPAARRASRRLAAASTSSAWRAARRTATRRARWRPPRWRPSRRPAGRRTRSTSSSPTRPTSASSRPWPRAWACPWSAWSSTSTATATRRRPRSPSPSTRPCVSGRIQPGDRLVLFAFGAGFTSGAAAITWTADPAASARSRDRRARGQRAGAARLGLGGSHAAAPGGRARRARRPAGAARRRRAR